MYSLGLIGGGVTGCWDGLCDELIVGLEVGPDVNFAVGSNVGYTVGCFNYNEVRNKWHPVRNSMMTKHLNSHIDIPFAMETRLVLALDLQSVASLQ